MATAVPRKKPSAVKYEEPAYEETFHIGLSAVPGIVVGLVLGLAFVTLASKLTFSSTEDIAIIGLLLVGPASVFGAISHLLGLFLLRNEAPGSSSRIFDGNLLLLSMLHGGVWTLVFGLGFSLMMAASADGAINIKEGLKIFIPIRPSEPPPITSVPSFPGGGGGRGFGAREGEEDPNRVKTSPSRYDRSGNKNPSPQERAFAEGQRKRDEKVLDTLKEAGLNIQGTVEYQDPKRP